MVIPYANLMIKDRVDKQASKSPDCSGICIDHNSNPMSESEQSVVKPRQFRNKVFAGNGEASKDLLLVASEGLDGHRKSESLTDGRDKKDYNRSSANSREFTEQGNHVGPDSKNRESCCSNDSAVSNTLSEQKSSLSNDANTSGKSSGKSKQLMKLTRGLKFPKGSPNTTNQGQDSPTCENDSKHAISGVTTGNVNSKKNSVTAQPAKKSQESKVRLFQRKRRNRNKLISNAGNSLWRPLGECLWASASGRTLILQKTKLTKLCDAERAALRQIVLQTLPEFQLGCSVSPPKDGNSNRRTWKQRLFLGRKDKDSKEQRTHFGIPISQVIANDAELDEANSRSDSRSDTASTGRRSIVRQEEVCKEDNDEFNVQKDDADRRNSLPNSNVPFLRSNSFNFEEEEGFDLLNSESLQQNQDGASTVVRREGQKRRQDNTYRRSRLLDALTLSSSSASYISIIDRDDELKPPGPQVPKIVMLLIEYIEQHALRVLGIFRTGGLRKRVRHMREELERGNFSIIHSEETNPQDVAALFKEFFRDLPDPLLTRELYAPFLATRKLNDSKKQIEALQLLIALLPVPNRDTLKALLSCLAKVASFSQDTVDSEGNMVPGNKMDSRNLATLIGPNILHRVKANSSTQTFSPEDSKRFAEENNKMIEIIKEMIENHEVLFDVSACFHDEVLRALLVTEPETVDYVLRKKASRVSQIEFPDDIKEELSNIKENAYAPPKRSLTYGAITRTKMKSRYSDDGVYARDSMRAKTSPLGAPRLRKISSPDRPGSIRSVISTTSEPDRYSFRRSNASVQSFFTPNRRSQSDSAECPEDEIAGISRNRCSYRDSGLSMGRNSQRFSTMEETRRKITALETVPSLPLSSPHVASKSSTPYSSPSSTPILEHAVKEGFPQVRLRERESRESRDSAYASGRIHRKGGPACPNVQGIFSLGEEDISPEASISDGSLRSPVFLPDILDEPAFNNNGKKSTINTRKVSLPAKMITDDSKEMKNEKFFLSRAMSAEEEGGSKKDITSTVRKAFLTWEETTWPHWDPSATDHNMPDHETIL